MRSAASLKTPNLITAAGLQLTCKLVSVQDLAKCDDTHTHTKEKQQKTNMPLSKSAVERPG